MAGRVGRSQTGSLGTLPRDHGLAKILRIKLEVKVERVPGDVLKVLGILSLGRRTGTLG